MLWLSLYPKACCLQALPGQVKLCWQKLLRAKPVYFSSLCPALSFITIRAVSYFVAAYLVLFGIEGIVAAFIPENYDM